MKKPEKSAKDSVPRGSDQKDDMRPKKAFDSPNEVGRPFLISENSKAIQDSDLLSRRAFMTVMGASLALAGLVGCRRPAEKIVPYVIPPENIIPGVPQYYATSMPLGLDVYGLVVECHEGRPTKIEGNEMHPSTLGACNRFLEASILGLYDPDRSRGVLKDGQPADWNAFLTFWRQELPRLKASGGEGVAVIGQSFSSPTRARLKREFTDAFPLAHWVTYEPVSDEQAFAGTSIAFGRPLRCIPLFDKAALILSLDSDFLFSESDNIASAAGFARARRVQSENDEMNRLYVAESALTPTGAMADHRLVLPSSHISVLAAALLARLVEKLRIFPDLTASLRQETIVGIDLRWLDDLVDELMTHQAKSLVVAGYRQPPVVHAFAAAMNVLLKNVGQTVIYRQPQDACLPDTSKLADLVARARMGKISTLIILGGNPVYDSPADFAFAEAIANIPTRIHLSEYVNETSAVCNWHINQAHYLETWGDGRDARGVPSVTQPMIEPLYDGKSDIEFLAFLTAGSERRGYDIVRQTWHEILGHDNFEKKWRRTLHDGICRDHIPPALEPHLDLSRLITLLKNSQITAATLGPHQLEVVYLLSASTYDGRYANNAWLQELPDPITKLVWDNAALMSPATAKQLGVQDGQFTEINLAGRKLKIPILTVAGMADYSLVLPLGYGRIAAGGVGNNVGFDTYILRQSGELHIAVGATITPLTEFYDFAFTQRHPSLEGRKHLHQATLEEYRRNPTFAQDQTESHGTSLYEEHRYDIGYQWGMAIDLSLCIGCGSCTVACQSENNIPVVGKDQVARGRHMHWIRVDRYFEETKEGTRISFMPVPCQHCENAPCEQVCPVQATVHDNEGLNAMVYNRCVGTRYCSNNCPYKVRRFNFFNYFKDMPETLKMLQNPDVTVRSRGVMEKCTYCVQRINRAKIKAKLENRDIFDGEIVTACQQACPTQAIVFGNIRDPQSRVAKLKAQSRNYAVLATLNTKPRTTYLAKISNPKRSSTGQL